MRRFGRLDAGWPDAWKWKISTWSMKCEWKSNVWTKRRHLLFVMISSWWNSCFSKAFFYIKGGCFTGNLGLPRHMSLSRNYAWGDIFYTSGSTTDQAVISPEVSTKWFGCHRKWRLEASQRTTTGGSAAGVGSGGVLLTQEMGGVSD